MAIVIIVCVTIYREEEILRDWSSLLEMQIIDNLAFHFLQISHRVILKNDTMKLCIWRYTGYSVLLVINHFTARYLGVGPAVTIFNLICILSLYQCPKCLHNLPTTLLDTLLHTKMAFSTPITIYAAASKVQNSDTFLCNNHKPPQTWNNRLCPTYKHPAHLGLFD